MPRSYDGLILENAKRMLSASETKAASLGITYNKAAVDAGAGAAMERFVGCVSRLSAVLLIATLAAGCAAPREPAIPHYGSRSTIDEDSDSNAFRYYAGPGADEVELPRH